MKVLHVTNLYPYKNAPTYGIFVKEQIESLNNKKYQDVLFINAHLNGAKEYLRIIGKLKKSIKDYDIVHCHHQYCSISVFLASPRKKIIVSILGDIEKRNRINKAAYYFSRLTSSKLIFKNKTPKDSSKNILLPNGVNFDFFKPFNQLISKEYLDLNIEKKYILFVSNGDLSNPIKRYDKFLDVFNAFTKSEKYNSELFEILHLNKVSREKVPYYYNSASLMIVTSDHEGSPNAVKEAMACDLPIISTPVGDVPILLENVTNCYVSKSWRVDELVSLVENIDFNKRSNGRQKLIELKLDSESVAEKLINVYKSLHLNY